MAEPAAKAVLKTVHKALLGGLATMGLIVSFFVWWAEVQREQDSLQSVFDRNADQIHGAVAARMETFQAILRAGAGYWAEHPNMGPNPWHTFVERALFDAGYAGIDGLALVQPVALAEREAFVADIRQRLWTNFQIRPPGPREESAVITQFEPAARRDRALGFDLATNPERWKTLLSARDSGKAALSPALSLVTSRENQKREFILAQPIFKPGHPMLTTDQRRSALRGWLVMGIHASRLIGGLKDLVPDPLFDFQVYSASIAPDNRIYDGKSIAANTVKTIRAQRIVDFAGARWIITAHHHLPDSAVWFGQTPLALLAASIGFTLALTAAAFLLIFSREQSRQLALQAMGRLSRTEKRLAAITAAAPGAVFQWEQRTDGGGRFTFMSPQSQAMFGIPPGKLAEDWRSLPFSVEDLDRWPQAMKQAADAAGEQQLEGRYTAIDNSPRWWKAGVRSGSSEDGIVLVNGFFVDITDQKDVQTLLAEKGAKLQAINAELEQFSYVASHDLQEPLRTIAGFLQLIDRRYREQVDSEGREFIAFAVEAAVRLQAMIQDLLEYSRIGTRGDSFGLVDLSQIITEARSNLTRSIDEAGAKLECGALPRIMADKTQILSLMQNLIGNALKYHRPDIAPEITVTASDLGEEWAVDVADNGIGIEAEYFDRIFLVFQRLHTRDKFTGTGIGLALCRKIARRHGGDITVTSTPGQGSCFRITLPKHPGL